MFSCETIAYKMTYLDLMQNPDLRNSDLYFIKASTKILYYVENILSLWVDFSVFFDYEKAELTFPNMYLFQSLKSRFANSIMVYKKK